MAGADGSYSLFIFIILISLTGGKKKTEPFDIHTKYCPASQSSYSHLCLVYSGNYIQELVFNSTSCNCSFYGFIQQTCADDLLKFPVESNITIDALLNYTIDIMRDYGLFITKYGNCHTIDTPTGPLRFPMIDSCPQNSSSIFSNQCLESPDTVPPLEYHQYFSLIFKNIYCAMCHGIKEGFLRKNMTPWSLTYDCKNGIPATPKLGMELLKLGVCKAKFKPPDNSYEKLTNCYDLHASLVDINQKECVDCLPGTESSLACFICKFSFIAFDPDCFSLNYLANLRVLFDFNLGTKVRFNGRMWDRNDICASDEIYDHLFQICRKVICSVGENVLNGRCVQNTTITLDPQSQPLTSGTELLSMEIHHRNGSAAVLGFFNTNNFVDQLSKKIVVLASNITYFNTSEKIVEASLQLNISSTTVKNLVEFIGSFKMTERDDSKIHFELSNFPVPQNVCSVVDVLYCNSEANLSFTDNWFVEMMLTNRTYIAPFLTSLFTLQIDVNPTNYKLSNACICLPVSSSESSNCFYDRILYNKTEFSINQDGILQLKHQSQNFNPSEYELTNSGAIICINTESSNNFFNMNPIQTYVSLACTALSVVALIITLILYGVFSELRNLPGKLTMGLSVFLIIGQILLVFPDLPKTVCRYVAVVAHYSWLTVFLWMGAVAVNMFHTFHPQTMISGSKLSGEAAFKRYTAVCLGLPLICCLVLLVLDQIPGNHLHVNYGQNKCTWMSSLDGYIYTFFVPVGLVLVLNVVCFSMTLYYISSTMAASDKITGRRRDRDLCVIYLKLATVMGFSWIFGFIAGYNQVDALWYVYIVLNGLQGFFIFFSFGMTSRTRRMVSRRLTNKFSRYSESDLIKNRTTGANGQANTRNNSTNISNDTTHACMPDTHSTANTGTMNTHSKTNTSLENINTIDLMNTETTDHGEMNTENTTNTFIMNTYTTNTGEMNTNTTKNTDMINTNTTNTGEMNTKATKNTDMMITNTTNTGEMNTNTTNTNMVNAYNTTNKDKSKSNTTGTMNTSNSPDIGQENTNEATNTGLINTNDTCMTNTTTNTSMENTITTNSGMAKTNDTTTNTSMKNTNSTTNMEMLNNPRHQQQH